MTQLLQVLWLAGFTALLVALVRATARARQERGEVVPRLHAVAAAIAVAALAGSAAWVWGAAHARDGMAKIRGGPRTERADAASDSGDDAPARARLFLRAVQLPVPQTGAVAVGYSPGAALRLPRAYGLDEAQRGWDLLEVAASGPQGLQVSPRAADAAAPEPTTTRIVLDARPRDGGVLPPAPDEIARIAGRALRGRSCAVTRAAPAALDGPGVIVAVLCRGAAPVAALTFERDLVAGAATAGSTGVRVTPLVWRGTSFRPHHVQIGSGALLQIGAMADAVPGVTLWEVPAPAGRAELFFPPDDILAPCRAWIARRGPSDGAVPGSLDGSDARGDDAICVLPFTPPFALEVRRLLPDLDGVDARSAWAAALLGTPALLALLVLAARPRGEVSRARFARALALGWVGAFAAAIGVWRLLWAHRIDMLRDYEAIGTRVVQNQTVLVLVAAALAATAVLVIDGRGAPTDRSDGARPARRWPIAVLAWGLALIAGGLALRGDLDLVLATRHLSAQMVLSLAVGSSLAWGPVAAAAIAAGADRAWSAVAPRLRLDQDDRATAIAVAVLIAVAAAAVVSSIALPRAVAVKLALAYLAVGATYAVLRAAIAVGPIRAHRLAAAAVALAIAAAALYRYDGGVTTAVLGPGLVLALLFASHDARYGEALLRQMSSFERHHAPLVVAHAAIIAAAAVAAMLWLASSTGDLGPAMTRGALHGLAVFAILMAAAAAVAYIRRGGHAATPWAAAAAILAIAWAARDAAALHVMTSRGAAGGRVAIVLDPGYALLRDESRFLAGITAWRETILPRHESAPDASLIPTPFPLSPPSPSSSPPSSSPPPSSPSPSPSPPPSSSSPAPAPSLIHGQGYFGSQLLDPGVLLSIENDYFPVLLLRETGALGIVLVAVLLLVLTIGLWLVAGERFLHGSAAQRTRALAAAVLGALCIYQPLASLGVLPLTGITWPGLGLDSPTDLWLLIAATLWILFGGLARDRGEALAWRHDSELRASRVFRRVRAAAATAAALVVAAGLTAIGRSSAFALERPSPIDDARTAPAFAGVARAIDYAYQLQCPWPSKAGRDPEALVPTDILGEPVDDAARRFHSELRAAWRHHRFRAVAELTRFLAARGRDEACRGRSGPWRFERRREDASACVATFSWGWPEIELVVTAPGEDGVDKAAESTTDAAGGARCSVELPGDVARQLRVPARRPYRGARVRLVGSALGAAAADRGELIAGHVTVRLRPGSGELDVSRAQAGLFTAEKVRLSDELSVEIAADRAALTARGQAWMFVKSPPRAPVHVLEADPGGWRLTALEAPASSSPGATTVDLPLGRMALLVVGGPEARSLWLFRPPRAWDGAEPVADPLLADDIATIGGERRRHYVYGGNLPELGWVNPYHRRMSLGLDGWVHAALAEIDGSKGAPGAAGASVLPSWIEGGVRHATCGTLAPPMSPTTTALDPRICSISPYDGVLECRVSLQPELAISLRHLTELIASDPRGWTGKGTPATRGGFALLRGDTGEIVAHGDFVPGRASSAYAPATPELEQHLMRLREDRDPVTGARLPAAARGEASAEKADWNQPVAVGSTLKPLWARAAEMAAPEVTSALTLRGGPKASAVCRRSHNRPVHAVLGHCPPTPLLTGDETFDLHGFLARSSNWYMASLGLLSPGFPDGGVARAGVDVAWPDVLRRDVGDWSPDHPLVVRRGDVEIIGEHSVSMAALRQSAVWQRLEAVLGRPLCLGNDKAACRRSGDRRDLCAARALPIAAPTADLRHLVAIGPDRFDLLGDGARGDRVPLRDYFQFLRGSGLHPLGSLLQLTDAFGRVVHDPADDGRFRLAASWFPVPAAATPPAWDCAAGGTAPAVRGAGGGLCGVVRAGGTAAAVLKSVLADPRIVIHGAKTGTIDVLADVSEDRTKCERWNQTHTVAGRAAEPAQQPYWLPCGDTADDDSLFLIAFSVKTEHGLVPFTLGLRFERSGKSVAAAAARHYLEAIATYVTGAAKTASPGSPSPSPSSLPAPTTAPPAALPAR